MQIVSAHTRHLRVVITFDDGYRDSAEYIASRAPRHPNMHWIFFVCPQKIFKQEKFEWDTQTHPDLICDTQTCRALQNLSNVMLGNHTNQHRAVSELSQDHFEQEMRQSFSDFETHFGACKHFAYPYGVPNMHFQKHHAAFIAQAYPHVSQWTTFECAYDSSSSKNARDYTHAHAHAYAHAHAHAHARTQPRFVFDNRFHAKALLLWMLWRTFRHATKKTITPALTAMAETP